MSMLRFTKSHGHSEIDSLMDEAPYRAVTVEHR
jgi:hypothetical protein